MRRLLRNIGRALATVALAVGVLVAAAFQTEYAPGHTEPQDVSREASGAPLTAGTPFNVVSWNVQYGAGRRHQFFYDGGEAVHVPEQDVEETVAGIGRALETMRPDVALIQEMDRNSLRTGHVDMLAPWARAAGAAYTTTAPYHRSPFVPKPFLNPLGRVEMHLAILSRSPFAKAVRTQLALLDEPRVVRVFNLKRALLTAEFPIEGLDQPLAVAVTHLSAFSFGDGTLEKQIATLEGWMRSRPDGQPWVLAGDMNLLPTGDDKSRLTTERDLYADAGSPIDPLLERYTEVLGNATQLAPENRTYLPFAADEPDRKIDYMFVGGPIEVLDARVVGEYRDLSDHLPILSTLRITPTSSPAP